MSLQETYWQEENVYLLLVIQTSDLKNPGWVG